MTVPRYDEFDYRGLNSRGDLGLIVGHVALPIAPAINESVESVPGRYGNLYLGTYYGAKQISIPCTMMSDTPYEHAVDVQNVSKFLISLNDNPGTQYPLILGFQPDVTYWGHFTEIPTPEFLENDNSSQFTLVFEMNDPRGCLPQVTTELAPTTQNNFIADGNTFSEPIVTYISNHTCMYFGYVLNGGEMFVGTDPTDETPDADDKYSNVVWDPCDTLSTWDNVAEDTTWMDGSPVKNLGTAKNSATSIRVGNNSTGGYNFGKMTKGYWIGPMLKYIGMSTSLENYRITVWLHHRKYVGKHNGRAMGKVGVALLNENGQSIGRMEIKDQSAGRVPKFYIQLAKPNADYTKSDGNHENLLVTKGPSRFMADKKNETFSILVKTTTKKVKVHSKSKVVSKMAAKKELAKAKRRKKKPARRKPSKKKTSTVRKKKRTVSKKKSTKTVKIKTGKKGGKKTTVKSKTVKSKKYAHVTNDNNIGLFSDVYVECTLTKDGDDYSWDVYRMNPSTGKKYSGAKNYHSGGTWHDYEGQYSSNHLASVGLMMQKYGISEDFASPAIPYKNCYLSLTSLKIDEVKDVDATVPTPIAMPGDEVTIDTETMEATNGNKTIPIHMSSTYPNIEGGNSNELLFTADGLNDQDKVYLDYTPRIK